MNSTVEMILREAPEWSDLQSAGDIASALSLPAESFLQSAAYLKDQVVEATWKASGAGQLIDSSAYSGLLGTAFLCLRSYEATGDRLDLLLAADIVDACATVARGSKRDHVTFLCGNAGVYALGAVVAYRMEDFPRRDIFLDLFLGVAEERALSAGPDEGGFGMPYELLHGRAGFLWAALFINKYLGPETIQTSLLMPIVEAVLAGGRVGASDNTSCPLMYRWHGTRYLGAAHGLAGILHVLLHFPLPDEDLEDVKCSLRYMVRNRFPQSGNYPSNEGNFRDKLVQWSHGATGVAITLCKAVQVFPGDGVFLEAAIEAGEVVWKRGLVEKVGLADGIAGNAYAMLSLFRLTGEEVYKERATAFAGCLYHNAMKLAEGTHLRKLDHPYSLFHGLAGTACFWFDMAVPENSRFPGFEL